MKTSSVHGAQIFPFTPAGRFTAATLPASCTGYGRICRLNCMTGGWRSASGAAGLSANWKACRSSQRTPRPRVLLDDDWMAGGARDDRP
jgi:hypothetical protein